MTDARAPRGAEWDDVIDVLHRVANVMTSRSHYPEGHPAIQRAVENAVDGLRRVLAAIPEVVVAILDGEFVVCDRPMPELRSTHATLAAALERHEIECMVFLPGVEQAECALLGRALALGADEPGRVRELAQAGFTHIQLRFADVRAHDKARDELTHAAAFVPAVAEIHEHVLDAFAREALVELERVRALARSIVGACTEGTYTLLTRCCEPGTSDQAEHATNVAMMTAALAASARVREQSLVEVTAAALLHDVGNLLARPDIRGLPEPVLDERGRGTFRNHPITGAWALLVTGCPPLWVAVALEHHRGVDGQGYPPNPTGRPPHPLVRIVALANYVDRKRTFLSGEFADPDQVLRQASLLEPAYFGPPLVARFLRTLGVFPPGTVVELSDRQAALVTRPGLHDPLRPQVLLLTGPNAGRQVDLKQRNTVEERHELSITRAILPPLALREEVQPTEEALAPPQPEHEPGLDLEARPEPPAAAEPEPEPLAAAEPEPLAAAEPEPLAAAEPEPETWAAAEPEPPAAAEPEPETWAAAEPEPPAAAASEPEMRPLPEPEPAHTRAPVAEPAPVHAPARVHEREPASEPLIAVEPEGNASDGEVMVFKLDQDDDVPAAPVPPPSRPARPPTSAWYAVPTPPPSPRAAALRPAAAPVDEEARLLAQLGGPRSVPALALDPRALRDATLDHREGFLVTLIDGTSTVEDLLDSTGLPRASVLRVLERLVRSGVVRMR